MLSRQIGLLGFFIMHILLSVWAGIAAAIGIGILVLLGEMHPNMTLLMAPFGATAVIIFGLPSSPLARPKNVILGHLITAAIGVCFVELGDGVPLEMAFATGLGVTAMLLTGTTHPPAGANPMVIILAGQGWSFLLAPVLSGAVLLVLVAHLANRFVHTNKTN